MSGSAVPRVSRETLCSKCPRPARRGQRLCLTCHREYMRAWREKKKADRIALAWELRLLSAKVSS